MSGARTMTRGSALDLVRALEAIEGRMTDTARASRLHGPRHARDVARCGLALRHVGVEADWTVVVLFAALHDSQRRNDGHDPDHGARAAAVARDLRGHLVLTDAQADQLDHALTYHDAGQVSDDPTIGACWDADRLTLWRAGIQPQLKYMSTVRPGLRRDRWGDTMVLTLAISQDDDKTWEQIAAAVHGTASVVPEDTAPLWYHGTLARYRDGILRDGLVQPTSKHCAYAWDKSTEGVYLTPNRKVAVDYAERRAQRLHRMTERAIRDEGKRRSDEAFRRWKDAVRQARDEPGSVTRSDLAVLFDERQAAALERATALGEHWEEWEREAGGTYRRLLITVRLPEHALGITHRAGTEGVAFPQRIPPSWFADVEEWGAP